MCRIAQMIMFSDDWTCADVIDATIKTHATNARHHAMYASARSKLKLSNGKVLKSACMLIVKGPSQ